MGAVNTTYTFTATDTITSTKMNNIIDQTTFTNDAVFDTTLAVASGKLKVNAQGITSNELAANSVITAKITDSNVTTAKIADSSITALKLDGAQTGSAPIFGIRAFATFNGGASSPITPVSSGNIASITRTSTGSYTVVMTVAMPSSSYCVVANATHARNVTFATNCWTTDHTTTTFFINTAGQGPGSYNSDHISFVVLSQ